ncbi:MAG: T9SS type A sorting domain-containing protein, partial [Chitinophagaceae bacterium]
ASKKYSTIEAYNGTNGITSPVIEILDTYNLGIVQVGVYQHAGAIRTYNGKPYLNRNYTIKPDNNPAGAVSISLRLFFTAIEFDALKTADPTIINPGSLVVIKQPNSTATAPAAYTPAGGEEVLVPTAWKAVDGGYYVEISVTGFSNFFIQKGSAVLPVTWLGVQAVWQNSTQANVSWQVAEQQNVKEYTVQHSEDGNTYTNVCTVAFSGITTYNCLVPANSNIKNYYRVLQQDIDGRTTHSKVVLLQSSAKASLTAYPNPAKDKLYIDGLSAYRTIEIMDASGKIIQKQNVLQGSGYIDIWQLKTGVYLLKATNDKETQTIKFIKY